MIRFSIRGPVAVAMFALAGACGEADEAEPPVQPVAATAEPISTLDDGTEPVLARPLSVDRAPDDGFVIPDRSHRDLKLYGADGRRTGTVGRAGGGPGEFAALTSGGVFRDSVYGFDMVAGRLYLFGGDGRAARSVPVPQGTWSVRAVDDSLFLVVRSVAPARRDALVLMRPDGSVRGSFFDASRFVGRNPELAQLAAVVADARDGTVFAGVFGVDTLYAFDYAGRQTGASSIDRDEPLPSFRELAAENGGRLRRAGGGWVIDGAEVLIALTALDDRRAVLHVQRFDAETGLDRVEGGRLLLFDLDRRGTPRLRGRAAPVAGLMGRDRDGQPLLLGYAPGNADQYVVQRLLWAPPTGDRPR
ncbi:hypothetical protein [Longimicrobium sp.]|uniref:hypothetical protein n=1 Tax=Longimicrobium sp. TaxID=2029185 RepID=UPI002E362A55|nr:hypothetical protein [Longimicrobium sp.]HEX6041016.1 hypothetical protein [Longimicrobium sp.]